MKQGKELRLDDRRVFRCTRDHLRTIALLCDQSWMSRVDSLINDKQDSTYQLERDIVNHNRAAMLSKCF